MSSPSHSLSAVDFSRTVWLLAIAETMFWASCFYVFHALLPRWETGFEWQRTQITTAITIALLSSAMSARFVGALIDRGFGRRMFIAGGLTATVLLLLLSVVESLWQFYAIWMVMGICHSAILYEPCFAILTRLFKTSAKKAITRVTLVAGLAGTVSYPLGHLLSEWFGWQRALWVFAFLCLIATVLASHALKNVELSAPDQTTLKSASDSALGEALRSPVFWLIAAAFSMMALNHGALLPHLLPLLYERNVSPATAVLAASLIGPMQVVGRICMISVEERMPITVITIFSFLVVAMASLVLLWSESLPWLLFVFVLFQGGGYGVTSITRPAVTAEFLGRRGFGAISGTIAVPFTVAFAIGPTLGALIWSLGGYRTVLIATTASALIGTMTFIGAHRIIRRQAEV